MLDPSMVADFGGHVQTPAGTESPVSSGNIAMLAAMGGGEPARDWRRHGEPRSARSIHQRHGRGRHAQRGDNGNVNRYRLGRRQGPYRQRLPGLRQRPQARRRRPAQGRVRPELCPFAVRCHRRRRGESGCGRSACCAGGRDARRPREQCRRGRCRPATRTAGRRVSPPNRDQSGRRRDRDPGVCAAARDRSRAQGQSRPDRQHQLGRREDR